MQYYTYQHTDGTDDVGPYHCYNNYNYVAIYQNVMNDSDIMKARVLASNRGATPVEIQENVFKLGGS